MWACRAKDRAVINIKELRVTKYDGIDGIVHTEYWNKAGETLARVSQKGIEINKIGLISTQKELESFAKFVSDLWKEHQKMVPKFTRSMSGHE